jgi:hypothetical protein
MNARTGRLLRGSFGLLAMAAPAFALACLSSGPGPRLSHFPDLAPAPGEALPELEVLTLDGRRVPLHGLLGRGPVVLQVGSVSCPVFRYRRHGMARLARELGDRVTFVVLYTREAHPVGSPSPYTGEEWDLWINRLAGVRVGDTERDEERRRRAEAVRSRLELSSLVVVDPEANAGWRALGRAPSAAFVIDRDGRVVARQLWVRPRELRGILLGLLAATA